MTPPIIANAGPLLSRYDAIFCDVWGVVHNGRKAYAEAGEALARFRGRGGTVILVSNAPIPASGVERVLEKTGVRRDAWDAIVSSGDIALGHIAEKGYRRMHWVGPSERDYALYVRLPGPEVPLADAEAIVCTGLAERSHRDGGGLSRAARGGRGAEAALRVRQSRSGGRRRQPPATLRRLDRRRVRAAGRGSVLGRQAASRSLPDGAESAPASCAAVHPLSTASSPSAMPCVPTSPPRKGSASTACSSPAASTGMPCSPTARSSRPDWLTSSPGPARLWP